MKTSCSITTHTFMYDVLYNIHELSYTHSGSAETVGHFLVVHRGNDMCYDFIRDSEVG